MIIDDISAVSLHGGVVRIQGTSMNADGQMVNTVILEIPATNIGMIIDKLASGVNQLGEKFKVPVLTDIHETTDAKLASEYVDYLQIPAFLCRQTDLLIAAGETGKHCTTF